VELTVESLIAELGLELASGHESAHGHVRWVHSTELEDPTPWLRGGELLLTTGIQLNGPKSQRELIERLSDHRIAGLGFGTGFKHKRLPAALVTAARKRGFPLFEVPYELPFIAITERAFAQLVNERYEMLQRNMAGDVLAEALTGHLYPEDLQARLRPFGIGDQVAVLAFALEDPTAAAAPLERALEHERTHSLVAIRAGLLCAVIDAAAGVEPEELARKLRGELRTRFGEVRAAASRPGAAHSLRLSFHEARCALEAVRLQNGSAPEVATYRDLGGPVEQDEGDYGEELLRSLDVFIEHNGHWEKAAGALFCHRHTLRYRVRRVEQLTGRDFSSARDRIEFWLALRGRELAR
jgi:purine catabolism regulator